MDNFKTIISKRRKELKMTQRELAEKINVSDKTISKWETGGSYPDVTILNVIAKVLEISITELLQAEDLTQKEVVETEGYDYNSITKFKTNIFVSIGLLISGLIMLILGQWMFNIDKETMSYIFLVLIIFLLISSFILFLITKTHFYGFFIRKFYTKQYNIVYYQYVSSFYHLLGLFLLIILILIFDSMNKFIFFSFIFEILVIRLLKLSHLSVKRDKLNLILFIFFVFLFLFSFFRIFYVTRIITVQESYFILFVSYIIYLIIINRNYYNKIN